MYLRQDETFSYFNTSGSGFCGRCRPSKQHFGDMPTRQHHHRRYQPCHQCDNPFRLVQGVFTLLIVMRVARFSLAHPRSLCKLPLPPSLRPRSYRSGAEQALGAQSGLQWRRAGCTSRGVERVAGLGAGRRGVEWATGAPRPSGLICDLLRDFAARLWFCSEPLRPASCPGAGATCFAPLRPAPHPCKALTLAPSNCGPFCAPRPILRPRGSSLL